MKTPWRYAPNWLGGISLGSSPLGGPNDWPVAAGVQATIFAYLYQQWTVGSGSDDLQALVNAYNSVSQAYVDWFCGVSLPIYTAQVGLASGGLLDWVALGRYGFLRPLLPSGRATTIGPIDSAVIDDPRLPIDGWFVIEPSSFQVVTDDIFKRIMTWHLYLGDGKQFSTRWLKRRVMRFLIGQNGTGGYPIASETIMSLDSFGNPVYWPTWYNIDDTSDVSLQWSGNDATITIYSSGSYSAAGVFQAAVAAGVLELPVPYDWTVTLS